MVALKQGATLPPPGTAIPHRTCFEGGHSNFLGFSKELEGTYLVLCLCVCAQLRLSNSSHLPDEHTKDFSSSKQSSCEPFFFSSSSNIIQQMLQKLRSEVFKHLQLGKLSFAQHFYPAGQQGAAVPHRLSCTFLLPRAQSLTSTRNHIFLLHWLFVILLCIAGLWGQPRLTFLAVLPTRQHFCPSYSLPHHCPGFHPTTI